MGGNREDVEEVEGVVGQASISQNPPRMLESVVRTRWAVAIFAFALLADLTLKKFAAPPHWCTPVDDYFMCVENPHEGSPILPSWPDFILLAFLLWPVTRLWAAIVTAGLLGNAIYSWTGAVPNVFVSSGIDGIGWVDLIWYPGDNMVAYNLADMLLKYGLWATIISMYVWGAIKILELIKLGRDKRRAA